MPPTPHPTRLRHLLAALTLLLAAGWTADVLSDLGLTQQQLETTTFQTATNGLHVPDWKRQMPLFAGRARALPAGAQAAAVRSAGALVKAYVMSDRFKAQWQQTLTERNIHDPKANGDYARLEQQRKNSAATQKSMQQTTDAQQQMAKMMKENPQMAQMMKQQMSKEQREELEKSMSGTGVKKTADDQEDVTQKYAESLKKEEARIQEMQKVWNENKHPALVRQRLQAFIQTANSVDFSAQLKAGRYGDKVFANPEYEKKSDFWKQLYRAGKEPVMAARDFAQQWLAEVK